MIITEDELKSLIIKTELVDDNRLHNLVLFAQSSNTPLVDVLIERDVISDHNLGLLIADYLKFPFVILANTTIPDEAFFIIPERIARKQKIIAFAKGQNGIKVAMADPRNREVQEYIARKTGLPVTAYFATEHDIATTYYLYRLDIQKAFDDLVAQSGGRGDKAVLEYLPVAKMVDLIINYAYQDKVSDIHIEPEEKDSLTRFRIDGILHDVLFMPKIFHDRIISRIKVLSKLRTDEHLSAQDGKMRIELEEETLDIRVSIVPVTEGEKAVLRLLPSKSKKTSFIELGLVDQDLIKVQKAHAKAYGMILSTGPTGSGKTTIIYSILKLLNTREKNITTIEDPVEYRIKGLNQIQVNTKTDLTFANGLRSILRQDPNVVFVGEIRDNETAGIAVNAALTGHLVLSTIHTNDAATTIPRLIDMDVEPFLVASTVNLIIAQRLVRTICEMCKGSVMATQEELLKNLPLDLVQKKFGTKTEVRLYQGHGCKICRGTGYQGRVGLFEVLEVTPTIKELISQKKDADVIAKEAINEGMTTMLEDGLNKVIKGITTIQEVLRVTKVEAL